MHKCAEKLQKERERLDEKRNEEFDKLKQKSEDHFKNAHDHIHTRSFERRYAPAGEDAAAEEGFTFEVNSSCIVNFAMAKR